MAMRYLLERTNGGGDWDVVAVAPSRPSPSAIGLRGSPSGLVRVKCDKQVIEVWQWSDNVPRNPADLDCQEFGEGWKLIESNPAPAPHPDELSNFFSVE